MINDKFGSLVLKTIGVLVGLIASPLLTLAQLKVKVKSFPVADVRLTNSPFKNAQDLDITYLLGLNADRLLAPYLKEAGLSPKAENYPNWENTGLDGHIGGHYLSALAYMYAATGNKQIKERLDYTLAELKRCQDAAGDGYLSGIPNGRKIWDEVIQGNIRTTSFRLNEGWVPLYNIHKIYAGLRDAYLQTSSLPAREMLVKLTNWMIKEVSKLSEAQIQEMLKSEHGGLNETFADVAAITGDKRYLKLAHQFSHNTILEPLLRKEDKLTGIHANTQIPKVIGYKRIADVEGNKAWNEAARFFWETVATKRSVSIGGNSVREHFHPSDDFSSMFQSEQGPETCNTYNMLRLTKMLYETSGESGYLDFYERAVYNHILSSQDPVQGGFVYFTPMRSGHYRVYSQPQTSFWCCVGSGLENHARYGEMIYSHSSDSLLVNLFIPSVLNWKAKGIEVTQQNNIPEEEATNITVKLKQPATFTMLIRQPDWVKKEDLRLTINGKEEKVAVNNGFIAIRRRWINKDSVHIALPMQLRALNAPDGARQYSFVYGPVVLAARIGSQDQTGMFADASRGGHIASGVQYPLNQMPVIIGTKENILTHLKKNKSTSLSFTMSGIQPARYDNLELVPFYRLSQVRYAIYFPLVSETMYKEEQQKLVQAELERAALDNITIDKVICGEQQPESDHFIQFKNASTGAQNGVQWRAARGWFSYQLRNDGATVSKIRIVFKQANDRDGNILLEDQKIGAFKSVQANGISVLLLDVPRALQLKRNLIFKVEAIASLSTPEVYEVRLLKRE